jgi:hypothetical protein
VTAVGHRRIGKRGQAENVVQVAVPEDDDHMAAGARAFIV